MRKTPYLPYEFRCKFAVECFKAIIAPPETQVIMLEWLLDDSDDVDNREASPSD